MARSGSDTRVRFLQPGKVRGQNNSRDPLCLSMGEFPLLQNLRLDAGIPIARNGCEATPVIPVDSSAQYRGSWSGTLGGTSVIVAAFKMESGRIAVFRLDKSTWAWTEITRSGTGDMMFGDTRMDDDGGNLAFCKVPLRRGGVNREVLLFSNGSGDYPRVYDPGQAEPKLRTSKLLQIGASIAGDSTKYGAKAIWARSYQIQTNGFTFFDDDGSDHIVADNAGTDPGRHLSISITAGTVKDDWCEAGLTSSLDLTHSKQIIFRVQEPSGSARVFPTFKIEFVSVSTGNRSPLFDPATQSMAVVDDPGEGYTNVVYYGIDLAEVDPDFLNAMCFRFTATVGGVAGGQVVKIGLIAGSGNIAGGTNWGVAYRNEYSGAESAGRIVTTQMSTATIASLGGCQFAVAGSPAEMIPIREELHYVYYLDFELPTIGQIHGDLVENPTKIDFYINEAGSPEYTYYESKSFYNPLPTYESWLGEYNSNAANKHWLGWEANTTADPTIPLPWSYHGYIPRPTSMYKTSGRLFMGSDLGATGDLYFSEDGFPLRFSPVARYSSGTMVPVTSSRNSFNAPVMGIAPMGNVVNGVEFGVPVLAVWTTDDMYRLYGGMSNELSSPVPLGPHGLVTRNAFARHYERLYWVDQERQIVTLAGTETIPLSRGTVERRLTDGDVSRLSLAFWSNRLYATYRRAGEATTVRALVFDEHPGEGGAPSWSEDLLPADADDLLVYSEGATQTLYFWTKDGHLWVYDKPGIPGDAGTGVVPVELVSPAIVSDVDTRAWARRVGIQCDGCGTSSHADVIATYLHSGAQAFWTSVNGNPLSLDSRGFATVWRRTEDSPKLGSEVEGAYNSPALQVTFRAAMPSGTRLLTMYADIELSDGAEDVI
jgi:hypothetical protein